MSEVATIEFKHVALLSAGSNMGEKRANCQRGISALAAAGKCLLVDQSPYYRTEPVDFEDQAWFVNVVFKIQTDLTPMALLKEIKGIEKQAGRTASGIRFGPRILDLDILLYDDRIMDTDALIIPHPRMHKRRFVLKPLCDIDSEMNHPVFHRSIGQLLDALEETSQKVVRIP